MTLTSNSELRKRKNVDSRNINSEKETTDQSHREVRQSPLAISEAVHEMLTIWTSVLGSTTETKLPLHIVREAKLTANFTGRLLVRDAFCQSHNTKMETRRTMFFLSGMICIFILTLLLFDLIVTVLSIKEFTDTLEYASQESTFVGSLARSCVFIMRFAETLQEVNRNGGGFLAWSCLCILVVLLFMIRFTTVPRAVLSQETRKRTERVYELVQNALKDEHEQPRS